MMRLRMGGCGPPSGTAGPSSVNSFFHDMFAQVGWLIFIIKHRPGHDVHGYILQLPLDSLLKTKISNINTVVLSPWFEQILSLQQPRNMDRYSIPSK